MAFCRSGKSSSCCAFESWALHLAIWLSFPNSAVDGRLGLSNRLWDFRSKINWETSVEQSSRDPVAVGMAVGSQPSGICYGRYLRSRFFVSNEGADHQTFVFQSFLARNLQLRYLCARTRSYSHRQFLHSRGSLVLKFAKLKVTRLTLACTIFSSYYTHTRHIRHNHNVYRFVTQHWRSQQPCAVRQPLRVPDHLWVSRAFEAWWVDRGERW